MPLNNSTYTATNQAFRNIARRVLGEEVAYIDLNTSSSFVDKIKKVFGFGN